MYHRQYSIERQSPMTATQPPGGRLPTLLSGIHDARVFYVDDFVDASRVPSSFERSGNPNFDEVIDHFFAEHVAGQAQDVQIVVSPAHFRRQFVRHRGSSYAGKLVRDDAHSQAGPANQDTAFRLARTDFPCNSGGNVERQPRLATVRQTLQAV